MGKAVDNCLVPKVTMPILAEVGPLNGTLDVDRTAVQFSVHLQQRIADAGVILSKKRPEVGVNATILGRDSLMPEEYPEPWRVDQWLREVDVDAHGEDGVQLEQPEHLHELWVIDSRWRNLPDLFDRSALFDFQRFSQTPITF